MTSFPFGANLKLSSVSITFMFLRICERTLAVRFTFWDRIGFSTLVSYLYVFYAESSLMFSSKYTPVQPKYYFHMDKNVVNS